MKAAHFKYWSEKGFAPVLIILAVALIAGVGVLVVKSQQNNKDFTGLKDKIFPNTLNTANPCANGWQDYTNSKFSYVFKIPPGWTDVSIDEWQTDSMSYRELVSTQRPEERVDPKFAVSGFSVIASATDLKYEEGYKDWFINYPDGFQRSQITYHGLPTELVVTGVTLHAGRHYGEEYYFEKGDIYYYLRLGIYTNPDVKAKNEAIVKCFLENFRILEPTASGMKSFTSQKLQFTIQYPAELFVHEWPSNYTPNYNGDYPDQDRNTVQFYKNENLTGDKITIWRDTNTQRKTAKDYAKAYLHAPEQSLQHWKPADIDFVVYTYKEQNSNIERKIYLTPLGDWMYSFEPDVSLQSALEKMLPTLKFTGTGEAFSLNLTPCPDNLLSTDEEIIASQENWWEKPDRCDSQPEHKICGYTRSIFDNGIIAFSNSDYRNSYCYCSFFNKNGNRIFRGTEMFALGYEEGACKQEIKQ